MVSLIIPRQFRYVVFDLPSVGIFDKEDSFGAVESVKAASDLMMPVGRSYRS